MKNKIAWIVGGVILFIIVITSLKSSPNSNNNPPINPTAEQAATQETPTSTQNQQGTSTSTPTKQTVKDESKKEVAIVAPDSALVVSCSPSQTALNVGQTAVWTAQSSGGNGSYSYSWSGSDGLSGSGQSVSKSYSSAGVKTASVKVVSGSKSTTKTCDSSITVSIPEPSPINLSGSGQKATQQFNLEAGLSIFTLMHSGSSNFSILLMDGDGKYVSLLVNEIGSFSGSKAVKIDKAGPYILNITADGSWTVNITQPRVSTASATTSFSGTGQQASQLFYLSKGLHVFNMTHEGNSNFAILLMDKNGGYVDLLVNEIGSFNGSKAVGISKSGIYLFDISADGNWSVSIQ